MTLLAQYRFSITVNGHGRNEMLREEIRYQENDKSISMARHILSTEEIGEC
jgi:hypothetical protein